MPPKRKTSITKSASSNKVAKTEEHRTRSKTVRVVIAKVDEEVEISKVEKEEVKTVVEAPLSAIAAKRLAIQAGLYKPAPLEESEEEVQQEEHDDEEDPEGIEMRSIGDDEELVNDESSRVISPISGNVTPMEESVPMSFMENFSTKLKNKVPKYMDYNSVSRFIPTQRNSCVINQEDDTYLFLCLKAGESILFMGQVNIAPVYGSFSIAGAVLSSGREIPTSRAAEDLQVSFYPAFSPRTHSLLTIHSEPMDKPSVQLHSQQTELDENLMDAVFDELSGELSDFESIIVIKDLEGSGLEDMRDAVTCFSKNLVKLTRKELPVDKKLKINHFSGFQPVLEPTSGIKALKIENSWEVRTSLALENASKRESPVVSIVCGSKDLGKSSYSRYLVNRLLAKYNRVAYIETDVGQSEFTPSGLLSLHYITSPILGPPYTHQQLEPERSFFFGSTSPRSNLDYYLACIDELVDHWKHDQEKVRDEEEREWIPLVVNTQGWVSGVGYNLLISQIQKVEPTDICTMRHPSLDYKNLPPTFAMDIVPVSREAFVVAKEPPVVHYLDCVLQDPNVTSLADTFTATQQREITLGSYFHQSGMGPKHFLNPHWDFKKHLVDRVPWVVDWRQSLNAIWVVYEEVKFNELFYALNGSIVGLIGDVESYEHQKGPKHTVANDTFTPPNYLNTEEQLAPAPKNITCHGLAVIRAIDPSRHSILLLTPVPLSTLEKVSCLMKGEMRLPLWSMFDHKLQRGSGVAEVPWKNVPYITKESTEGAGSTALRVRRNLLRRSQA